MNLNRVIASLGDFLIDTPIPKSPHENVKMAIYCDISLVNVVNEFLKIHMKINHLIFKKNIHVKRMNWNPPKIDYDVHLWKYGPF